MEKITQDYTAGLLILGAVFMCCMIIITYSVMEIRRNSEKIKDHLWNLRYKDDLKKKEKE